MLTFSVSLSLRLPPPRLLPSVPPPATPVHVCLAQPSNNAGRSAATPRPKHLAKAASKLPARIGRPPPRPKPGAGRADPEPGITFTPTAVRDGNGDGGSDAWDEDDDDGDGDGVAAARRRSRTGCRPANRGSLSPVEALSPEPAAVTISLGNAERQHGGIHGPIRETEEIDETEENEKENRVTVAQNRPGAPRLPVSPSPRLSRAIFHDPERRAPN